MKKFLIWIGIFLVIAGAFIAGKMSEKTADISADKFRQEVLSSGQQTLQEPQISSALAERLRKAGRTTEFVPVKISQ